MTGPGTRSQGVPTDEAALIESIGYHLRTPMNAILGALDVLLGQLGTVQQRQLAEMAYGSTEQMLNLVNDALELARLRSGSGRSQAEPFSPQRLLDGVITGRRMLAGLDEGELGWEWVDGAPWSLVADVTRVRQALCALLDVALTRNDAAHGRGKIVVQAELLRRSEAVAGGDAGAQWRIAVILSGPGLERIEPRALLEPFPDATQAAPTTQPRSGLAGLLASELARVLGGAVVASRAIDGSLVLALEVPVSVSASAGTALENPPRPFVCGRAEAPTVLLVDDNAVGRYVMCRLLEQLGARVLTAETGEAAIRQVRAEEIDLVLMDCLMPGIDGLEATRRIREEEPRLRRKARLPVIALTARASADDESACREAGMDGFLAKPVRSAELRSVLVAWLGDEFMPGLIG